MTDKDAYTKKLEAQMKEWQANIDKMRAQAERHKRMRKASTRNT